MKRPVPDEIKQKSKEELMRNYVPVCTQDELNAALSASAENKLKRIKEFVNDLTEITPTAPEKIGKM